VTLAVQEVVHAVAGQPGLDHARALAVDQLLKILVADDHAGSESMLTTALEHGFIDLVVFEAHDRRTRDSEGG
jgi:hypothetical protein